MPRDYVLTSWEPRPADGPFLVTHFIIIGHYAILKEPILKRYV